MKIKTVVVLVTLLALGGSAFAQGQSYTAGPFNQSGNLYVCPVPSGGTPCPAPVSIFTNVALSTAAPNPIPMNAGSTITFFAASGQYTIQYPATGYSVVVSLGSSGGGSSPNGATIYAWASKYNLPGPAQWVCDAGITNASNVVTTPTTDPPFTGNNVRNAQGGDIVWASSAKCGNDNNLNSTVAAFFEGVICTNVAIQTHQISVCQSDGVTALNSTGTCTPTNSDGCPLVWGPDHSAAVQSAWSDTVNAGGSLALPSGGLILKTPPSVTNATCQGQVAGNDSGQSVSVYGPGPYSLMLLFPPSTSFANQVFNATCAQGGGSPIRHSIHDFGLASFVQAPAAAANKTGLSCPNQESQCYNLWFLYYFPSLANNFTAMSSTACGSCLATSFNLLFEDSGFNALALGGTFSYYSNIVISNQGAGNALVAFSSAGASIYGSTLGSGFGAGGGASVLGTLASGTPINLVNDVLLGGSNGDAVVLSANPGAFNAENVSITASGNKRALVVNVGSTAIFDGESNTITGAGTGEAINIASGGTVSLRNTVVTAGTGVSVINAGTLIVKDGDTFPKGITNTGVIQVVQGQGGYLGACTGVVTSAATVGLYNLGQTTATTCTSTTVASGQVMSRPGTVYALYCTATAGNQAADACTVVKNGVAQTMTCSLNAVTSCTDGTVAHQVAFVAGDILGIEVIGGTATTLANVKGLIVAP